MSGPCIDLRELQARRVLQQTEFLQPQELVTRQHPPYRQPPHQILVTLLKVLLGHSFHLKKSKKTRKIGCKLCDTVCTSNKELTQHHQLKHNILYCDECSKAFNNPSSLAKHQYSHKELRCKFTDCAEEFAFESNLRTHHISHRTLATHCCAYPNCKKRFKNKGNLTRHVKEHDGVVHECPDCQYKNSDIRNLASHRLTHTDIEKYACELCSKMFRFSTQKRRHLKDRKCP